MSPLHLRLSPPTFGIIQGDARHDKTIHFFDTFYLELLWMTTAFPHHTAGWVARGSRIVCPTCTQAARSSRHPTNGGHILYGMHLFQVQCSLFAALIVTAPETVYSLRSLLIHLTPVLAPPQQVSALVYHHLDRRRQAGTWRFRIQRHPYF